MNILKKKLLTWAENYMIQNYEGHDTSSKMIPIANIQAEMTKAIERERDRVNALRDIDEKHKMELQAMDFFIVQARLKAENINLRAEINLFQKQKADVAKLRNVWLSRSDKIVQMASRMKHEGDTLHANTDDFIGAITAIYNEIKTDSDKFDKISGEEQKTLGQS